MPLSSPFVELHARSAFSFLRGAAQPEDLMVRAAECGMPALAICDRDGVYGTGRAHYRAREVNGRAIVGAEVTLTDGSALPLLVQTRTGYQNLCQMITRAKLRAPKGEGAVAWEELEEFSEGLICLSGDEEGPVRQALDRGQRKEAEAALHRILQIYGKKRTWVELQRHRVRGERWLVQSLVDLARANGVGYLASNGASYVKKAQRPVLDAFTCLRHHTTLDEAGALLSRNAERYLKDGQRMTQLFADLPEAIHNTSRVAAEIDFTLTDLGYEFPRHPTGEGESMSDVLRRETYAGAAVRYGKVSVSIRRQLDHELDLIERLGFCGYFLIVWEIMQFAKRTGVMAQGRGSAANSAVCYSLGITNVDPVEQKLLFERFLSEGRKSWPDIDIDLPSGDRRESVIQYVYEKYAPRGAAMTANVICYRGRSAMREMGKVIGVPEDVLGRFSDLRFHGDYRHTLELEEHIEKAGMPREHPRLPALVHLYQHVHGLPRHLGQHSGGMIVSDRPLDTIVPLENASMPGRVVVQWDKDDCEDLGIIKVDLLGLGMLSAMQDSVTLCEKRGHPVDLAQLPYDDPGVYAMLQKADTIGLFQVESRAQMAALPKLKPDKFYDIVIQTALIRPGPIVGKMVHPYINRRNGREEIEYIDDIFKPTLERTLGVPLFQEQVLKMAMDIANFSGSEAEELRRAMSFNRSPERMNRVMKKLYDAMTERGVSVELQERIVQAISSFAQYGFPESHAISFGLIAYASAYLKVHHPAEFYVGLLNNQPMGFYSPATLIKDAKDHGIRVRPVNVQTSEVLCTVEEDRAIRLGLRQVKGLSRPAAERIAVGRPYRDLPDFLLRTSLKKDERRQLARIGALADLTEHRRDAMWQSETEYDPEDLFRRQVPDTAPMLAPMTDMERLATDYAGMNLSTGPHPMKLIRGDLSDIWKANDLQQARPGSTVWIAGLVICRQRPGTAKGHVFISLEDETGIANAFVPGPVFEEYRLTITQEVFLRIRGRVQDSEGVISIYTEHLEPLQFQAITKSMSHDFH